MNATTIKLLPPALIVLCALLLQQLPAGGFLDRQILDGQFRHLRNQGTKAADDVVVVGIDEAGIRQLREPLALWHPHLGKFFDAMLQAGPSVVGIDLILPGRSYEFLIPGYDRLLLGSLSELARETDLLLGQTLDEGGRLRRVFPPFVAMAGRDSLAMTLMPVDPDGTIRRMRSHVKLETLRMPALAAAMAARLGHATADGLIDYSLGGRYRYIPFTQVLEWYDRNDLESLKETFAGKPVILGSVLPFTDRHNAPVALAAWEGGSRNVPGVLIHAQSLRTHMRGGAIQHGRYVVLLLCALFGALLWYLRRPLLLFPALAVFLALSLGASTWALAQGVYFPVLGPALAGILAVIARLAVEGVLAYRERRCLNLAFSGYVCPQVFRAILGGRLKPGTEGERKRICILFSDIRNFTPRCEQVPPEIIVTLLNRYFDQMTGIIHQHEGTVKEFMGDGIMAFFGAPNPRENPAQDGFDTAKAMLARMQEFNHTLRMEGVEEFEIVVALHVGEVVVGHVGSRTRHDYAVIGDAVNVASRLEGLSKKVGYPVVCSSEVEQALSETDKLACLGKHSIKGHTPIEVFGWRPSPGSVPETIGKPK